MGRAGAAGVTPLGEAFNGLVALSALPLVADPSRVEEENGPVGGATSRGSGGGLVLSSVREEAAIARPSDGEGTAVCRQRCVPA